MSIKCISGLCAQTRCPGVYLVRFIGPWSFALLFLTSLSPLSHGSLGVGVVAHIGDQCREAEHGIVCDFHTSEGLGLTVTT